MMSSRTSSRVGFTLLEVLLALTLTAVAATVAGAALQAARHASTRVAEFSRRTEPTQQMRVALHDLLRHAPPAEQVDEALFALRRGPATDTLVFLSRGVQQPFGTGEIWRVLMYADSVGLTLRAEPVYDAAAHGEGPPAMAWHVPGASELSVALASFDGRNLTFRRDWPLQRARPAGVRLSWRAANGEPAEQWISLLPFAEAAP
jgi:general secretion pathway protein J